MASNSSLDNNPISSISNNLSLIVLCGIFLVGGFFIGSLWQENKTLKSNPVPTAANAPAPADAGPTADQLASLPVLADSDHVRGNRNAEVVLIEYSDFECPFCQQFHPTMQQVMAEYGDKIAWAYRHYPLDFHPNAQKGAEASECIAKLGGDEAFWKYVDAIFEKNGEMGGKISPEAITEAATTAGVNMTSFQTCLDNDEMAEIVMAQMEAGALAGVQGTPGTFIVTKDGVQELIPGAVSATQLKASIDKYLK